MKKKVSKAGRNRRRQGVKDLTTKLLDKASTSF